MTSVKTSAPTGVDFDFNLPLAEEHLPATVDAAAKASPVAVTPASVADLRNLLDLGANGRLWVDEPEGPRPPSAGEAMERLNRGDPLILVTRTGGRQTRQSSTEELHIRRWRSASRWDSKTERRSEVVQYDKAPVTDWSHLEFAANDGLQGVPFVERLPPSGGRIEVFRQFDETTYQSWIKVRFLSAEEGSSTTTHSKTLGPG